MKSVPGKLYRMVEWQTVLWKGYKFLYCEGAFLFHKMALPENIFATVYHVIEYLNYRLETLFTFKVAFFLQCLKYLSIETQIFSIYDIFIARIYLT